MPPRRTDVPLVVIRGAGDLATGVALSFHAAGFAVVMTEIAQPLAIRLTVSFASAIYEGRQTVDGVQAERTGADGWPAVVQAGRVAVVIDPEAAVLGQAAPDVIVDAIMAKQNRGTFRVTDCVVIALGPGFTAGRDADAVVETCRGHQLGRIIREGTAQADTATPGEIGGRSSDRVLRAPASGRVTLLKRIGELVAGGEPVMRVGDVTIPAPFSGCLRGAISEQVTVSQGMKIGDIDPRGQPRLAYLVSDKARAVGRAALEAALLIGRERRLLCLLALHRR